jgi:DNA-binding IclR family transcriptional regulator
VLELLAAAAPAGLSVSQIAERAQLNRVTAHRILAAYKAHGFVRQDGSGEPYRLGFKLVELAQSVLSESDLVRLAQPVLDELVEQAGETCHLAVLDGAEAVYVAKVESSHAVRLVSRVGLRLPLYCTGLGKALLAWMDEPRAARLIDQQSFERRTNHTIVSRPALLAALQETRERGYALDLGENEVGVRCVAAAVRDREGRPVAAVSVSGPEARLPTEALDDLGRLVARTTASIASTLDGGRSAPTKARHSPTT